MIRVFEYGNGKIIFLKYYLLTISLFFFLFRNIPVDFKYITDPTMHSMPAVAQSRNGLFN
jgi:hypothetical protein